MQFKQVIGQKETKSQLIQMVQQNRLSHALLFLGKEGTGGLSMARAFVQYIVCEKVNGKPSNNIENESPSLFGEEPVNNTTPIESEHFTDSCGICAACVKSSKLIHPDIHFSYPVVKKNSGDKPVSTDYIVEWRQFMEEEPYGNSFDWLQSIKAENKQGNISVHECNDIIRKMSLKSFESEYKFLIIWMPELLGNEGNRLLKLIEEPPPNTVFILVAENEDLIIPTILSRTQLIKLGPLRSIDIEAALELREGASVEKATSIAALSEGNYHEALQQLKHAEDDWEILLRDWLNSIIKSGPAAQVKWVEEISKIGREKQKQFLKYFNYLLEHAIRLKAIGDISAIEENSKQASMNDFAQRFNKMCDVGQQEAIIKELDLATYYIERNANAKILFHALTIKIYHIISNKSVILMQ